MTSVSRSFQLMAMAFALLLMVLSVQARAEDAAAPEAAWQAVVTGQINAFRVGDGAAALGFAGAGFKARYSDPEAFVVDIARSGYAPIMTSISHSFGEFDKVDEKTVMQVVKLVGPNQTFYEAMYQLRLEADGWRVEGVALKKSDDISI